MPLPRSGRADSTAVEMVCIQGRSSLLEGLLQTGDWGDDSTMMAELAASNGCVTARHNMP